MIAAEAGRFIASVQCDAVTVCIVDRPVHEIIAANYCGFPLTHGIEVEHRDDFPMFLLAQIVHIVLAAVQSDLFNAEED